MNVSLSVAWGKCDPIGQSPFAAGVATQRWLLGGRTYPVHEARLQPECQGDLLVRNSALFRLNICDKIGYRSD